MDNSSIGRHTANSLRHHPGPAPSLVFLHGWCCDGADWDLQLAYFKGRHEILAPDLPGHGAGPGAVLESISMARLAEQQLNVLAVMESDAAVLVGHSMGGPVALEMAARKPEQVAAVILVDSFLIDYGGMSDDTIERLSTAFDGDFKAAMENMVKRSGGISSSSRLQAAIMDKMTAMDADSARRLWRGMLRWKPDTALRRYPGLVHAINSPLVKKSTRNRLSDRISDTVIPETGHFLHRESPELFNQALEQRLRALELDQPPSQHQP